MATNRLESDRCVGCGEELIYPFNVLRCCSKCTEIIARERYKTVMRGKKKSKTIVQLKRGKLRTTTAKIGDPVPII